MVRMPARKRRRWEGRHDGMALTDQEKLQIREVVDQVVEARLLEFSQIQLTMIADMLIKMTDQYVASLMKLCGVLGLSEVAGRKEAERMARLMVEGLKK